MKFDRHFIKQEIEDGGINLIYISTNLQEADILTKAMNKQGLSKLEAS